MKKHRNLLIVALVAGFLSLAIWLTTQRENRGQPAEETPGLATLVGEGNSQDAAQTPPAPPVDGPMASEPRELSKPDFTMPLTGSLETASSEQESAENTLSSSDQAEPVADTLFTASEGARRMYAAHASLRTPEVNDPDSRENRVILQTMITKAIERAEAVAGQ